MFDPNSPTLSFEAPQQIAARGQVSVVQHRSSHVAISEPGQPLSGLVLLVPVRPGGLELVRLRVEDLGVYIRVGVAIALQHENDGIWTRWCLLRITNWIVYHCRRWAVTIMMVLASKFRQTAFFMFTSLSSHMPGPNVY